MISSYLSMFNHIIHAQAGIEQYTFPEEEFIIKKFVNQYIKYPLEKSNQLFLKTNQAIKNTQKYLLENQTKEGYWIGELEANTSLTSEYIMFRHYMDTVDRLKEQKAVTYLLKQQQKDGGWNIYYGGPSELSCTIEAYFALKLAGVSPREETMLKAKELILNRGGISEARVFTKIFLALFNQYKWEGISAMPVELMLLPPSVYINIYELSSWSRSVIVPLLIIFAQKPVHPLPESLCVDELYLVPKNRINFSRERKNLELSWSNFFMALDALLKILGKSPIKPLRKTAIKKAKKWILDHQDKTGDWGGIIPAMMNSIIALKCFGYKNNHPRIRKGLRAIERFALEKDDTLSLQSCISPVWDTAIACNALRASGISSEHPALIKTADWLISKQIKRKGDWQIKNPRTPPGGWAFEFNNDFYPDNDDTAEVIMALTKVSLPEEEKKREAIKRGLNWLLSMQSDNGGWGAFDINNNKEILNKIPFADLESLLDPPTADVTGRVLWLLGRLGHKQDFLPVKKGCNFLKIDQENDGSWYGRWGVNYIYGTFLALKGLKSVGEDMQEPYIQKAVRWIKNHQNTDGGWGESCKSYEDKSYRGIGKSTASQTAWAILGLLAAEEYNSEEVQKGINFLLERQKKDGTWDEDECTGTGFPKHFYIKYHMYRIYFPLLVLAQYRKHFLH